LPSITCISIPNKVLGGFSFYPDNDEINFEPFQSLIWFSVGNAVDSEQSDFIIA
jgi:hypothetical protein